MPETQKVALKAFFNSIVKLTDEEFDDISKYFKSVKLKDIANATYQGKVYYFCSVADREEFLKDPAAYLKKRGQQ